jgi:2-oxoisovalerate dehydrogenase E2 component (dihydrolipoyl transacylase)
MAQVTMPQLGETVTEGTVGRWLKKVGDKVEKYEPLFDVETDKVASEIPSPFAGTLTAILAEEGTTVPVGAPVCEIAETGAARAERAPTADAVSSTGTSPQQSMPQAPVRQQASGGGNGVRYSPAVRKLAREHQLDLGAVAGTGRGGRVTARDVVAHVESRIATRFSPAAQVASAAVQAPARTTETRPAPPLPAVAGMPLPTAGDEDTVVRLTPMRKTIAERMVLSSSTIPQAWCMMEADVTELSKWRDREKAAFKEREGVNLTYLPIVTQAVCRAIKEFPHVNSTWGGDHVIVRKHVNVGIAIDIEEGLVVPVVRDADRYSLAGLAQAINELVERARKRRLTMADLSDGTITVDNTGALGNVASVPIINPPQAAIITMEAVVKRPWVVNDAIAIRSIMNLCLCIDHRVLDGAVASRFLGSVKKQLEGFVPS